MNATPIISEQLNMFVSFIYWITSCVFLEKENVGSGKVTSGYFLVEKRWGYLDETFSPPLFFLMTRVTLKSNKRKQANKTRRAHNTEESFVEDRWI